MDMLDVRRSWHYWDLLDGSPMTRTANSWRRDVGAIFLRASKLSFDVPRNVGSFESISESRRDGYPKL